MEIFSLNYIKNKWAHAGFQRYFQNISWMFFARIGSMVISFISTAYIARNLGVVNYGQLSYATSFVSLFSFLAAFGIDQILCRDLVRHPEKKNEYMGTALVIRLSTSALAFLLCIFSAFTISSNDISFILIFIISLAFIFSSFQLLSYEFQAEAKLKYPSILSTVIVLILNLLKIFFIFNGNGVIYLAGVILLEPILYALGLTYLWIKEYGTIRNWRFDKAIAISIVKDSFPLIFASAFFAIYARIDQVMLKNMVDTGSVGLYDSAVRISEVWYFIPHIIVSGLLPSVVNAKTTSHELYSRRVKKLFLLILITSVSTAIITTFFSKHILLIIFGDKFIGALDVLRIYVWSNIGAALSLIVHQILITEDLPRLVSLSTFLGMLTNVVLNLIFIPKYGMVGAAYATLISYLVPSLSLFLFKKTRRMILSFF